MRAPRRRRPHKPRQYVNGESRTGSKRNRTEGRTEAKRKQNETIRSQAEAKQNRTKAERKQNGSQTEPVRPSDLTLQTDSYHSDVGFNPISGFYLSVSALFNSSVPSTVNTPSSITESTSPSGQCTLMLFNSS